jgi:UDP-GlcNAc:undecaprenyl-phosphate GlcNAc-1-phosphate transferase
MAMFVTMLLLPLLMRKAEQWQFVDIPDQRKIHNSAIPRIGGLAMVAGSVIPMMLWLTPSREVVALLVAIFVIVAFGVWDDRTNLNYKTKFLGQSIGVLIVIVFGGVKFSTLPMISVEPVPDIVSIPLTFLFLLGVTNAINLSDGLDGLAGGTTMLSFGVIAVLGYLQKDLMVVVVSIAVLGSIFGFLRFNTHPAQVFMGDGGSQFLGFSVGVVAVILTQRPEVPLSPALPLLLLGLPILDTLLVMGKRIQEKRSPFSPDKNHIHHRLLALGFGHYEAVVIIYGMQSMLVIGAYLLRDQSDDVVIGSYLLFCLLTVAWFNLVHPENGKSRLRRRYSGIRPLFAKTQKLFRGYPLNERLIEKLFLFVVFTLPVYLLVSAVGAKSVSSDIGILAVLLIGATIFAKSVNSGMGFPSVKIGLPERINLYVICTLNVYLSYTGNDPTGIGQYITDFYILFLAFAITAVFGFSNSKTFKLTPLDFLVLFAAFLIPNLPGNGVGGHMGIAIAQLLVLFYAIEFVLSHIFARNKEHVIDAITLITLVVFAFKAFYVS